jgi:cytoskeleton protein RodZ
MAAEGGSIGARLRAGREKHSLTILQVAERIHTDPKIVEAIEADNFPALGAPVYARGHIRHYAELVGESATELIGLYSDLSKVAQPDLTQIVKASPSADTNKLVAPALVVIAVFAVAGAVWWVSSLSKKKPQLSETHVLGEEQPGSTSDLGSGAAGAGQAQSPSPGEAASPDRGAHAGAMSAQPPGSAVGGGSSAGTQARAGGSPSAAGAGPQGGRSGSTVAGSTPQARPAPGVGSTAPAHPMSGVGESASARPVPGTSSPPAPAPVPGRAGSAQVTLRYSADSWTEVYDANGARLFYDVGSANSVQTVVGAPPLRVVLGNASGVAVEFNGHSMPVAKLAHPDGSVQFSITRSGRVIRAKPVADGG